VSLGYSNISKNKLIAMFLRTCCLLLKGSASSSLFMDTDEN